MNHKRSLISFVYFKYFNVNLRNKYFKNIKYFYALILHQYICKIFIINIRVVSNIYKIDKYYYIKKYFLCSI